ncbi:WD40-repeat-containing domain protein [Protomyces lactucae-debilis]|uniref:WD40-repeat-containing domain protein n=1 Tax=Protomyces lactucae-debilis TaxID=2754530 RepID=A0A1Y2F675_PROLT|nr:WD40-repeat-containing domain protein [Protomyces lactucae-debilis]ORY79410.1 WD40-repeat-containing domain protein [Protomyces lactucae-debilis]
MCYECERGVDGTGSTPSLSIAEHEDYWPALPKNLMNKSLLQRSLGGCAGFRKKAYGSKNLIFHLDDADELSGHHGCVNALSWSEDGRFLASGSDDTHIMLWDAQQTSKGLRSKCSIHTGHRANIFDVQWMPDTGNSMIVSAAGDSQVRAFDVEYTATRKTTAPCRVYSNSTDRVKKIVTENSHMFMTCSEDGSVRQYDLREGVAEATRRRPLVHFQNPQVALTALTLNHTMPYLFATGGSAPFAFLHDRRMLRHIELQWGKVPGLQDSKPSQVVRLFSPRSTKSPAELTSLKFSKARPTELLCSWQAKGIYVYDINGEAEPIEIGSSAPQRAAASTSVRQAAVCPMERDRNHFLGILEADTGPSTSGVPLVPSPGTRSGGNRTNDRGSDGPESESAADEDGWETEDEDDADESEDDDGYDDEDDYDDHSDDWEPDFSTFRTDFEDEHDAEGGTMDEDLLRVFFKVIAGARKPPKSAYKSVRGVPTVKPVGQSFREHINEKTTKDVCYYGLDDEFIMSGSDEGALFIWDRSDSELLTTLRCDNDIVNTMAPHPFWPQIAVSGIDHTIKILEPFCPDMHDPGYGSETHYDKIREGRTCGCGDYYTELRGKAGSLALCHETVILSHDDLNRRRSHRGIGQNGFDPFVF